MAKVRGIARKDNAATAFKTMIKKLGLEYSNNKFTVIDPAAMAAAPKTPKTPKTPKSSSPKKRKQKASTEDGLEDKQDESASPRKKARGKRVVDTEDAKEEEKIQVQSETDDGESA